MSMRKPAFSKSWVFFPRSSSQPSLSSRAYCFLGEDLQHLGQNLPPPFSLSNVQKYVLFSLLIFRVSFNVFSVSFHWHNHSVELIELQDKEKGCFCFQSCQNHCRKKLQSLAICLKLTQINIVMQIK